MSVHSIHKVQQIPVSIREAWDFFSNPSNLKWITPDHLGFEMISNFPSKKMYPGQIIEYKVRPLLGISVYWMTEITHVKDQQFFVDEQRMGPYRFWHHQHHFKSIPGGVEMTDIVHYSVPFGILGDIANSLFVKKELARIFEFRFKKVMELFGEWENREEMAVVNF